MTQNPISLQVSLPEMLDLALGTPEVGSINLNILHNFLHVLLHQVNLINLKIEYRGDDANRIKTIVSSLKSGPSIYLHEYSITDSAGNVIKRTHAAEAPAVAAEIYTVDSKTSADLEGPNANLASSASDPIKDGAVPSALGFKKINETVEKLEKQFRALEELATNPEIIERIKTSRPDPLNDMWSMININKRLDASEQGISKLMTMLQDIIKSEEQSSYVSLNEKQDSVSNSIIDNYTNSNDRLTKLETDLMNISETYSVDNNKLPSLTSQADQVETRNAKAERKFSPQLSVASGLATAGSASGEDKALMKSTLSDISSKISSSHSKRSSSVLNELKLEMAALKSEVEQTKQDIEELRYEVTQLRDPSTEPLPEKSIETESDVRTSINEIKSSISKSSNSKRSSSGNKDQVDTKYSSSFIAVEESSSRASNTSIPGSKEIGITDSRFTNDDNKRKSKSMGTIKSSRDSRSQNCDEDIKNLASRILALEQKIQTIDDDRKILIEQIDLLKILKADKEDLEDALTDKADIEILNNNLLNYFPILYFSYKCIPRLCSDHARSISNDRFDSAIHDLTHSLEAMESKLTEQENTLSDALNTIQQIVDKKLDKVEISPIIDHINDEFQVIQEKFEDLEEERQKNEAAGTKKILNDVLCISCNKNVMMRMDQGPIYKNNFISHESNNNKPLMRYNSNRMKKQLKQYPGKNINQFAALMKDTYKKQNQRNIMEKSSKYVFTEDHFCNRYCGGSHTITTAQQRIMRAGPYPSERSPKIL
ncbi:GSCOCG00006154001-RA-CDS, partial [Cotesia congregata]